MRIEKLNLNNLRNDAHFQYGANFIALAERYETVKLKIAELYNRFAALHADEDTALKKFSKAPSPPRYTKPTNTATGYGTE